MKSIKFFSTETVAQKYYPEPMSKNLPEWFKELPSFMSSKRTITNGQANHTAKQCMPMFDAITAGYALKLDSDIYVELKEDGSQIFHWPTEREPVGFHPPEQASTHKNVRTQKPIPKWISPWSIQTPKGYSTMFVNPINSDNEILEIFEAIVDTDQFIAPVNLPFLLKDPTFEGLIPAGTIIAQAIPFKRDSWKIEFPEKNPVTKDFETLRFSKIYHRYKTLFWSKKQWN
jgi:hypothetical protein